MLVLSACAAERTSKQQTDSPLVGSADCPKVGEKAIGRPGQTAARMANMVFGGAVWTDDYLFVPLRQAFPELQRSWVGMNAFGAATRVQVTELRIPSMAVKRDQTSFEVLKYATFSGRSAVHTAQAIRVTNTLRAGGAFWIAGRSNGGPAEYKKWLGPATFSVPAESTHIWQADKVIELECVALVNESDIVTERLY